MFFYYNKIVIEFLQQLEVILSHDSVPTSKVCLIVYQYACWNGTHTVLHFDLFTADDAYVSLEILLVKQFININH